MKALEESQRAWERQREDDNRRNRDRQQGETSRQNNQMERQPTARDRHEDEEEDEEEEEHGIRPRQGQMLYGDEEEEEEEDDKKDKRKGPRPVYPGLLEPNQNQPLKHKVNEGTLCGGSCERKHLVESQSILNIKFDEKDDILTYLRTKRRMLNKFGSAYPNETIYTLLGIFEDRASGHSRTLKPLLEKQEHYKSFMHFMREFESKAYPNIKSLVNTALETMQQEGSGLDVRQFHLEMMEYIEICDLRPDDWATRFINKLEDKRIKDGLLKMKAEGRDGLTMAEAATQAADIESRLISANELRPKSMSPTRRIFNVNQQRRIQPPRRSATPKPITRSVNTMSRAGRGGYAQRGRPMLPRQPARYGARAAYGGYQRQTKSPPKRMHRMFEKQDLNMLKKAYAGEMQKNRWSGCFGCLSREHEFDWTFKKCRPCPFCQRKPNETGAHVAVRCRHMPREPMAKTSCLKRADSMRY